MSRPRKEHGIEHEPQLEERAYEADPTERVAEGKIRDEQDRATSANAVEHTVWEEPALSGELTREPTADDLTYTRWLTEGLHRTSRLQTWGVTLLVALSAGPFGIFGAIGSSSQSSFAVLLYGVLGPVTEEIAKIAIALWVVEKRPYLFSSIPQILLCAACGGLGFATIENLVYIHVYFPGMPTNFASFRWTACTGLHVGCSFVAGVGLARIWDNAIRNRHRPRLGLGGPWFAIAMAGHGLYNLSMALAESAGWLDFTTGTAQ